MQDSSYIRVVPDAITFRDLKQGESDTIEVWATNIGRSPIGIRFSIPPGSPFELIQTQSVITPPGLEAKASIKYIAKDLSSYNTELLVSCSKSRVSIPISVSPPCPRITSDVQTLKLGSIGVNLPYKFAISLTNIGVQEGPFSLKSEFDSIEFLPQNGVIQPSKYQEISVTVKPQQAGDFDFTIDLDFNGQSEPIQPIRVSGTAVPHSLALYINDKEVKELDFGMVFYGQRRIITATIVNNGPAKRSFVFVGSREDTAVSNSSNAQEEEPVEQIFSVLPSEGMLEPHGKMNVNFSFAPAAPKTPIIDDIDQLFTAYNTIEVVETAQHIEIALTGKGVHSFVQLSSYDFMFEKCERNVKQERDLTITNNSRFLPISYRVHPIAQYRFKPPTGEIGPHSSKTVKVIFFPKNYGEFNLTTIVNLGEGLIKKVINLNAVCGQLTDHPFRRIPQYETNETANYNAYHPDKRFSDGIEGLRRTKKLRETFDGYITDYAKKREIRTAAQATRQKMRSQAIQYLTSTQGTYTKEDITDYLQTQKRAQTAMEQLGLNELDPYDALTPPDPKIRNTPLPSEFNDPLKPLYDTQSTDAAGALVRAKKVQMDDNVLIKKKFKSKPTTPAEINECSRPLTPAQQLMVVASHQNMNFGQVSVHANMAKSFTITNNLQQHILVTINYEHDELAKSTPASQIVLPKQTAGFDIRFSSPNQQNFSKTIQYQINHHHTYSLNITAKVVPIDLQLSRSMIEFRFSPDSITPFIKEFVIIQNKSNAEASYVWSGMNSVFSLSQASGTIEPLKSQNIEITYTPTTNSHDETTLLLNVTGGSSRSLKCIGDIGIPKCSLNKKFVNFGLIPIGIQKTQTIKIKNTGDDDAIFSVSYNNVNELQVIPANGRIAAHESQTFQLNFKSLHAAPFDIPVNVSIAGANPISFNVMGQSELPSVQLLNSEFEFGRLFVGSSASIEGTIQNTGNIPAILFLDLSNHPDFRIEFSTELANEGGGENHNSIALVSNPVFVTKSEQQGLMSRMNSQVSFADTVTDDTLEDQANGPGLVYKFYLVEGSTIKFNFVFQPTEAAEHSFELPFTMMNVISASSFHLQPIVSAESIKAPLTIQTPSIDFGVASIFNPSNPHCRPIVRQITFNNEISNNLPWRIDTDIIKKDNPTFTIEPNSGIMIPNSTATVHVSFMARVAEPCIVRIPVYVKTDKDKEESIVGEIQLSGVGTTRLFSLSTNNVVLPVVPLGVKAQQVINLMNDAFIESTLKVEFSASEASFPVKVNFPEGNQIQHTQMSIPIVVSFQSNKPMSFSTMVAIYDNNGNAATFSVYCTTDNSLFTLYPFFKGNDVQIKSAKGNPITVDTKVCSKVTDLTGRFISAPDVMLLLDNSEMKWESSMDKRMTNFIQRYMNALLLGTQLSDFPNDFIRNDCALILELIYNLSGGRRPNVDATDKEKPKDAMQKHLDALKRILHFIQSMGCLVSTVRPEFLLPRTEFLSFMRHKFTKQLLGIDYFNAPDISSFNQATLSEFTASKSFSSSIMAHMKAAEQLYIELCKESLNIIIMQLFKVFILGKIDVERLNNSPGVADAMKAIQALGARFTKMEDVVAEICRPGKHLQTSPVFSTAESVLLKWVSVHTCNQYNDLLKSVNNFSQLKNATAFLALLKAHTTVLKLPLPEVVEDSNDTNEYAINFTSTLKELKLAFCPTADEISSGSACMLAIITAYLFETLPRYISSTTIEYQTAIHKTVTKGINIQNPSKAEITYRAKLEGSHNYSIANDTLTIAPGASQDFNVTFAARTMKPQAGRLILSPQRPRMIQNESQESSAATSRLNAESRMPSFSAPIVIDLISDVSITAPDYSQSVEGQIYQQTPIAVPIKNYIGCKAKVKIFSRVFMIADENGKQLQAARQITQQINDIISDPNAVVEDDLSSAKSNPMKPNQFHQVLKQHQIFTFAQTEIDFPSENSKATLNLEFIPISLGTFRCLILFQDINNGEFIVEVIGKTTLPNSVEACQNKFKCEAGKKVSYNLSIDTMNPGLMHALAYSAERMANSALFYSDRKFKELVQRRQHEYESIYKQFFSNNVFTVVNSAAQYFDMPPEITVNRTNFGESNSKGSHPNILPITFKPAKAGQYPVHLVLNSKNDIRCFTINAVGLAATKELSLDFTTVSGKPVKQDIPFTNPSEEIWNFKFVVVGDSSFSVPQRLSVKPLQTGYVSISFNPQRLGTYAAELQATNTTKESTVIYKLSGVVEEPPAERKINIQCQARNKFVQQLDIKPFIKNGILHVTTTVPIITFESNVMMENGQPSNPWTFTVLAPRSGVSAGTITFTDPLTGNFVWYIIEIQVDSPSPEQTIKVTTLARKTETIKIPIHNTKKVEAHFTVVLSDDDLFGDNEFRVPPESTANYELIVSPLKAMARNSSVYFYSDDDGEFWYAIKIVATDAPTESIAPLSSPIGKHASTYILLENPLAKSTTFRYENSNPTAFHVIAKRLISLLPLEKKRIEVRYIPTTLGVKETTEISFHGTESGDYTYTLSGTGKPPAPLSPIIVNGALMQPSSALVLFTNPFPYPARFQMSLNSEYVGDVFKFLLKKKNFQLTTFGEEFQIPFTFNPQQLGQFSAHIIVAYTGPARGQIQEGELPSVRWIFPVIGNSVSVSNAEIKHLKCRAMEIENAELTFTLVGETEVFETSEYSLQLILPPENDFLRFNVDMKPAEVHKNATCTELVVAVKFSPQRPVSSRGRIIIKNPLAQEWSFDVQFTAERGKPTATISIEAPINKTGTANVVVPTVFRSQTPFHSYMVQGSASEFTLTADHGFIEPSIGDKTDMPFQIIFAPKMYGKVLQGLLVVDTLDSQYIFEVVGKTPEYIPPVIKFGNKLGELKPEEEEQIRAKTAMRAKKKTNFIKENIENAKHARIVSPHTSLKRK